MYLFDVLIDGLGYVIDGFGLVKCFFDLFVVFD